jgi:putative membrane protein
MSEVDDKYQQQILFDEVAVTNGESTKDTPQIIVENHDWLPESDTEEEIKDVELEASKPKWLWRMIAAVFVTLVVVEATQFFIEGFSQSPVIAGLYAALLAGLTLVTGRAVWREFAGFRQFKYQQDVRQQAQDILADESQLDAISVCEKITQRLPCDLPEQVYNDWKNVEHQDFNDVELMQLYSRNVLAKIDQKALNEVAKFSTESVVLIALSPVAVIDMLLMLWRNLRMINKVAALYGLKLGYWSRIKLVKQVIVNMAYAGASELVADLGADLIGADLLGKLSARMAQGLGAGMLTARLGLKIIRLCRPIPFEEEAPKLGQVRQQVIKQVRALVTK